MNKKSFGLDIGVTSIKLVYLDKQKNGYILKSALTVPAPIKGIMSESPVDQEGVAIAIQKAVVDAKIDVKNVNVALPENQVYTKILEMPVLSERELSSAIYWEAERQIPVPLSNITLAWYVAKKLEQKQSLGEKMEVLMVGAPTVLINKYQKIFAMAGLSINNLETEILSTSRSLVLGESFPTTLIISIGATTTSLAIVKNGVMIFTYTIAIGGVAINRAISTDLALTTQQAEEYKRAYGINEQTLGGKISKAVEPILSSILTEVKKAITFYNGKYTTEPIMQILLSGGTAKLPGIDLYFAQNSGIETAIANPWKVLAPQQVPKEILDNASDYSVAVGLAMKDYE